MGVFDATKCLNVQGTHRANSDSDTLDMWGTIKGSPQFDSFKLVDKWGNLGSAPASGPWEVQKGTVEDIGTDMSHNTIAYTAPITVYASVGCTGIMDGLVSGASTWTIQGGTQTIGGVSYPGTGLIITTRNNTNDGVLTIQTGATYQCGIDLNAITGAIRPVTLQTGATLNLYGANTSNFVKVFAVTNNVGGIVNWKGPGVCGQGMFMNNQAYTNNGVTNVDDCQWSLQTSLAGSGTINILDGGTFWNNSIQAIGSTNTFNINGCGWCDAAGVKQGAIYLNANTTFSPAINVQTASCLQVGANASVQWNGIVSGSAPLRLFGRLAPVNGTMAFTNTANTYSGTMTVDGITLNQSTGNSLQFAKIVLANGGRISTANSSGQTIGSLASSDATTYWMSGDFSNNFIKANGVTTYAGKLLWAGGSNTANFYLEGGSANVLTMTGTGNTGNIYPRNGAKLILQGATFTGTNGQVRVSGGGTISAGTSTTGSAVLVYIDATSILEVRAVGAGTGILNVGPGTSSISAGWKVAWPDAMNAGSYVIMKNTGAAITQLPATGVNNSGRTITYAWNNAVSPKTLTATLV